MIEFLNIKAINNRSKGELMKAFEEVLDGGCFLLGKALKQFEKEFAAYCNTKHCIGVANGLDALSLIFKGYIELGKLQKGDV